MKKDSNCVHNVKPIAFVGVCWDTVRMQLYRFSPIDSKERLLEAIKYIHISCFKLCKQSFGKYLPVAGNVGVFCHYPNEYAFLTDVRKELAETSDDLNQKYFRLHEPIKIPADNDIPETIYTHLYIRKPDPYRAQVGDVDFVLEEAAYAELKNSLLAGTIVKGARVFERPDLDMVELYDFEVDALGYVSPREMISKGAISINTDRPIHEVVDEVIRQANV